MNNNQKALNLLGLAMRAGQLKTGETTVIESVRSGRSKVVIVACNASENTLKLFRNKCAFYDVPLYDDWTREEMSQAIGKNRTSCTIIDKGFAKALTQLMTS